MYTFYMDKGFLGYLNCMYTPHRGTIMFPLNFRLLKENYIFKKIRIRIKWAHGIVKIFWKLIVKFLNFKLDSNPDLHVKHLRVSHLLANFRNCYRGNSLYNIVSFSYSPPTIDEHVNNFNK